MGVLPGGGLAGRVSRETNDCTQIAYDDHPRQASLLEPACRRRNRRLGAHQKLLMVRARRGGPAPPQGGKERTQITYNQILARRPMARPSRASGSRLPPARWDLRARRPASSLRGRAGTRRTGGSAGRAQIASGPARSCLPGTRPAFGRSRTRPPCRHSPRTPRPAIAGDARRPGGPRHHRVRDLMGDEVGQGPLPGRLQSRPADEAIPLDMGRAQEDVAAQLPLGHRPRAMVPEGERGEPSRALKAKSGCGCTNRKLYPEMAKATTRAARDTTGRIPKRLSPMETLPSGRSRRRQLRAATGVDEGPRRRPHAPAGRVRN